MKEISEKLYVAAIDARDAGEDRQDAIKVLNQLDRIRFELMKVIYDQEMKEHQYPLGGIKGGDRLMRPDYENARLDSPTDFSKS